MPADPAAKPIQPIQELIVCSWEGDAIGKVIQDFRNEFGIQAQLHGYASQEAIIQDIRNGYACDVLIIDSDYIPILVADGLVAEIEYTNVPNFRNISANFRNLAYDPYNKYSIPYSWGTTGLIVRRDLAATSVDTWSDLWDASYTGRVAVWKSRPRYTIGAALLSLGYSANSEDPQELRTALQALSQLKQQAVWLDGERSLAPLLAEGKVIFGMGWADDFLQAHSGVDSVDYILPAEGAILWGDAFTIPSNSSNQRTAALLINFFLRPEISARIINSGYYPMPNDLALPMVEPTILANPVIYPPEDVMQRSEILLPLSRQGQMLYDQIWKEFLAMEPEG